MKIEDFDTLLKESHDKNIIIEIGATWCSPCKKLNKELYKLKNVVEKNIDIYKVTDDYEKTDGQTSEKSKALYKKIEELNWFESYEVGELDKIENKNIGSFPRLYLLKGGNIIPLPHNALVDEISTKLDEIGLKKLEINFYKDFFNKLNNEETYKKEDIKELRKEYNDKDIYPFLERKLKIKVIKGYLDEGYDREDIILLIDNDISSDNELAKKYFEKDEGIDVDTIRLIKKNISYEQRKKYDKRFNVGNIIILVDSNISPEIANNIKVPNDYKSNPEEFRKDAGLIIESLKKNSNIDTERDKIENSIPKSNKELFNIFKKEKNFKIDIFDDANFDIKIYKNENNYFTFQMTKSKDKDDYILKINLITFCKDGLCQRLSNVPNKNFNSIKELKKYINKRIQE